MSLSGYIIALDQGTTSTTDQRRPDPFDAAGSQDGLMRQASLAWRHRDTEERRAHLRPILGAIQSCVEAS